MTISEAQSMLDKPGGLHNLPACGGLALLWSLIGAFDNAFEEEKTQPVAGTYMLTKLYEASLTVTVRIRVAPEKDQLILDNLSYAETIRCMSLAAAAESFYVFTSRIVQLSAFDSEDTGPKCAGKLEAVGVQWKGKPCDRSLAYSLLAVAPYTKTAKCVTATRRLEGACPTFFSDSTRLTRVAQVISKESGSADEADKTWATLMDWVRVCILTGEEGYATVGDFTVDNLTGTRNGKAALRDLPTPPPGARGGGGLRDPQN